MKIGVLTSSRADYGIYLPLLNELKKDTFFVLEIIAFGTHLSDLHGFTLDDINRDDYNTIHEISSLIVDDSEKGVAISYGNTVLQFADFWSLNKFDMVLCLGDRFEMSAAVQASIPFGVKIAHFHGGETTLGAIDNIYRHQITLASKQHYVSTEESLQKVAELIGSYNHIYNVGSMSLSNIEAFRPLERCIFLKKHGIKEAPYILATFHPETISVEKNIKFANIIKVALHSLCENINIIITMPNADTMGSVYRAMINDLKSAKPYNIFIVENFGKSDYFNAMFHSSMLLGNSSSGIIEAASFNKYVVNVGNRQLGRAQGLNVQNVPYDSNIIIEATNEILKKSETVFSNIYYKRNTLTLIIDAIKLSYSTRKC
ncbi:UDP-N-acetylglucosamine 2-epimerase [Schleiferiaceae bacterium]|nr:UDP-N-acetylglucosamine 2-epimerase [Schleiferiaceae bacterium]